MGLKCLLVAVLFMSPSVFGRDCSFILNNKSTDVCDECIRCGGKWCSDISETLHCVGDQSADNWCPANQDKLPDLNTTLPTSSYGSYFEPLFVEKRAFVRNPTFKSIKILRRPPVKSRLVAYSTIVNATQDALSAVKVNATIQRDSIVVKATFDTEFCSPNSSTFENVYVKVGLYGVSEESVLIMYQVPCGCSCSDRVEKNSSQCSGLGDLSCGACHCREDRKGTHCEFKKCSDRGDNPPSCNNPSKPEMKCSGNGHCNECNECECFTNTTIDGSQYFDKDNYCEDLCSATNKCADCLKSQLEYCDSCVTPFVYIVNTTTSVLDQRDESGRKVWVHCNLVTDDSCKQIEYAAMQRDGEKHVMILKGCDNTYLGVVGATGITVPVVSTLLAVVAMMAAAAVGYMVWKGKGAAPLPLTSPEYTNIDAEDCTGVNPLYKPPTSSFKNPMYGKS